MLLQDITRNRIQICIKLAILLPCLKCTVQFWIFTTKSQLNFCTNFKTRLADRSTEPCPGGLGLHRSNSIFNDTTCQTTPAGMQVGDFRTVSITKYYWQTVCRHHHQGMLFTLSNQSIANQRLKPHLLIDGMANHAM